MIILIYVCGIVFESKKLIQKGKYKLLKNLCIACNNFVCLQQNHAYSMFVIEYEQKET